MSEIASRIAGSEKLTSIFGRWPSFHDAEVHELHFWRGHIDTDAKLYDLPVLTAKIHLWLMTGELDQKGYFVLAKHALATIKFSDVDNFKMEGFNHQNAIFGLNIEQREPEKRALRPTSPSTSTHPSASTPPSPASASKSPKPSLRPQWQSDSLVLAEHNSRFASSTASFLTAGGSWIIQTRIFSKAEPATIPFKR